jgi:hypothetical protein
MSGGLLDAVERLTAAELDAAEYGWLGLPTAAQVVAHIRSEIRASALDDDHRAERLEHDADRRYADSIPADSTLPGAFRRRPSERRTL